MEILSAAVRHACRSALIVDNVHYTYRELLKKAVGVARRLEGKVLSEKGSKWGPRVGVYAKPGVEYVTATWATWLLGGIVVPLGISHPQREIDHVIQDATISMILTEDAVQENFGAGWDVMVETVKGEGESGVSLEGLRLPERKDGALIIYTSGTTGRPKGALHTHRSLCAQMESLSRAWGWEKEDVLLHALPLHHIHGIVNALYTAHFNGACVHFLPKFSPAHVWSTLKMGGISLFMGVPTMYAHLLSSYEEKSLQERKEIEVAARQLRLYVSGSSACPVTIMNEWRTVTGHWLLERYGTTEIGMALSNPLHGERRPGFVGMPLPGISVKVLPSSEASGELLVKGETLFSEYWCRPEATAEAFDSDGYFRTGDIVATEGAPSYFKILGRQSVDIIKSGGYKLSALEIESAVLEHPDVKECSVVGIPDTSYGETVAALVSLKEGAQLQLLDLQRFLSQRLAKYKIPSKLVQLKSIPRNAMGKVNKKELLQYVIQEDKTKLRTADM